MMSGIAGVARAAPRGVGERLLKRMAGALRHRGEELGWSAGERVGLAQVASGGARAGAEHPWGGDGGDLRVVLDGEVYNSAALRRELQGRGYRFRTEGGAELLAHGYEAWGAGVLERLNGQFAFALYDRRDGSVLLARDRFGTAPLFYALRKGDLYFASEARALFATGEVEAAPDLRGVDEVFTFWAARAPRTPFRGVAQLEPGCWARWREGRLVAGRYYALDYAEPRAEAPDALEALDALLRDAVALRLPAEHAVAGYLSGGLDSSITCTLAAGAAGAALPTYAVAFDDPLLDERGFQRLVARELGADHQVVEVRPEAVGRIFPDVIEQTETPVLRTAPAPLFLLARRAREDGVRVVLTGEGADELFLGYDLFKEVQVRRFCLRQPDSAWRPYLFDRLYPYLGAVARGGEFWRRSFLEAGPVEDPLFSHLPRFALASRIKAYYSEDVKSALIGFDPLQELREALPAAFGQWSPLNRAAYLEMVTLLPSYLLGSQGERMAAASGVRARYPFLDHRLFEFAARLPARSKLRGLREKEILRRWSAGKLPAAIVARGKQPYRAPDIPAFFAGEPLPYVADLLDPAALREVGIFRPDAVTRLVHRCRSGRATGVGENQALVAILSTQLWHRTFFGGRAAERPAPSPEPQARAPEWASAPTTMP